VVAAAATAALAVSLPDFRVVEQGISSSSSSSLWVQNRIFLFAPPAHASGTNANVNPT
jgi:hypothetical protein